MNFQKLLKKYGLKVKAALTINRKDISGVKSIKTANLFEQFGEVRDVIGQSFPGIYIWFKAELVEGLSAEDILADLEKYIVEALYIGVSDNLLDRLNVPRCSNATDNALSRYMFAHGLEKSDIVALAITLENGEMASSPVLKKIETELHQYNQENRDDGFRHTAADYSAKGGKLGTDATKVDRVIDSATSVECNRLIAQCLKRKMMIDYQELMDKFSDSLDDGLNSMFEEVEE